MHMKGRIMSVKRIQGEIAQAQADIIVNAANGCGWMGGKRCQSELHQGVSEHINYYTKGAVEKEALISARKYPHISSWICGYKAGDFFTTSSGGLTCKQIIHAVTMRYPGSRSKMKYIISLIPKIFDYCSNSGYKSIAIPCLGCGTGGLKSYDVISLIESESKYYPELDITIYVKGAKDILPLNVCGESGKGKKFVYRR